MHSLICYDIDGTLVETKSGETFRQTADDWQWLPRRLEMCKRLAAQGVAFALITNQAGVAFPWSRFTESQIQAEIDAVAREIGADFVGVCYTTPNPKALPQYHNPSDRRRKPGCGMIEEAMQAFGIDDPRQVLMIGDREEDEAAAKAACVDFMTAENFFSDEPIIV